MAAGPTARTGSGTRKAAAPGVLGSLLARQRSEAAALSAARPTRHGNFGGSFRVHTVFGTQHVSHSINASGDVALPEAAAKRRTTRAKMPMAAPIEPRKDPKSERVIESFVKSLLGGPFNTLVSTIVKDLEGYAFGSNAFNAGKVLMQDHTFFAAVATWLLQAHLTQQAAERESDPKHTLAVGPVGALADASVFSLALRLTRELLEKKGWLPLAVMVSLLRQLFTFLDEMVRYGNDQINAEATTIRSSVFLEAEILNLMRGLIEAYEPHRLPPAYMADCAIMTHAVLRQLEGYGRGGGSVFKKKKKKKKKKKAGQPLPGEDGELAEGVLPPDDDDEEEEEEDVDLHMEESALDFEHELYKFAGQREIVSRYVTLLSNFETVPIQAIHCALKLISRLVRQCQLEGMLFQLSTVRQCPSQAWPSLPPPLREGRERRAWGCRLTSACVRPPSPYAAQLHTFLKILESPAIKQPQYADLASTCRYVTRRFFDVAASNPAAFVEVLVWKRASECELLVSGVSWQGHQPTPTISACPSACRVRRLSSCALSRWGAARRDWT